MAFPTNICGTCRWTGSEHTFSAGGSTFVTGELNEGGCVMADTMEDVAHCNRRAEEFRRMAAQETDPKLKRRYTEREERWLVLAAISCDAVRLEDESDAIPSLETARAGRGPRLTDGGLSLHS
jgi:hypothetical protein